MTEMRPSIRVQGTLSVDAISILGRTQPCM